MARGTLPIEVGSHVGPYEVRSLIGSGGMGVVYEACPANGAPVALKVLHPQRLDDQRAVRRLADEAIAGQIVRHPNITATVDSGATDEGLPFLVMERICGEPLGTRIQRDGVPSLRRSVSIVQQILDGLTALHGAGLVHGDVKSDNVLIETRDDGTEVVHLIDFGLSHVQFLAGDVRKPSPDEELVSGTPEYMAPEVIRGLGSTTASDLYAVGIILYELVTGSTPFAGGSAAQITERHLSDQVVPPSLRCDDVPPVLERIILRALEKEPARRFPSAAAFGAALAVTVPLLEDSSQRPTIRMSRDTPTLDWHRDVRKRIARGSPRYGRRR